MALLSRPRESASVLFLNELLGLFRYLAGSGCACLLALFTFVIVLLVLPV